MTNENTTIQSDADPSDPYRREAQMFPRLSVEMANRAAMYGATELIEADTIVYERGQRAVDFFLVLEGSIEVCELDTEGRPNVFTTHGERQFTGELNLLSDRQVLISGRTAVATKVVRVKPQDFRRLISSEPDMGEIIMRALILRRVGLISRAQGGVVLIGRAHDRDTLRLQRFLLRNAHPYRLLDSETDADAGSLLNCFKLKPKDLPIVIVPGDRILHNPSAVMLAEVLGLTEVIDSDHLYDVAIVGAGPAGLSAAVYAASEGLDTIVLESIAPGGQAGTSSKIENYLGFPTGISGQALAGRAQVQAHKFGARLAIPRHVTVLDCGANHHRLTLDSGQTVKTRAIVIATGARYRKLDVPDYGKFEGQGIHYAATAMEAQLCRGEEVVVVGGGNSAGQAALFLSRTVAHVHMLVRASGLSATMSDYLVQRIIDSSKITLHPHCEISALHGDARLRQVTWRDKATGTTPSIKSGNLFVVVGAEPNTDWLQNCLDLDAHGFVITGRGSDGGALASPYATTRPGIFAVGDVRSGSVKRVAASVGEGAVVVAAIHQFLSRNTQ